MSDAKKYTRSVEETQRKLFGERYVGASLSKFRAPEWVGSLLLKFIQNPKNFLVFCGNPGIGKTYLCAALVEIGLSKFNSFRYWNESELLKKLRSAMDDFRGDYLEHLKYLIDDDLVILDDIGSTGLNEWRKEIIFDALDERYCSMKPTVITSNFSKKEFLTHFPERLGSRLFSSENIIIEMMDGPDLRLENN